MSSSMVCRDTCTVRLRSSFARCLIVYLGRLFNGAAQFSLACPRPAAYTVTRVTTVLADHTEI